MMAVTYLAVSGVTGDSARQEADHFVQNMGVENTGPAQTDPDIMPPGPVNFRRLGPCQAPKVLVES